jgi:hypothetical protein
VAGRADRSRALLVEAGAVVLGDEPVAAVFGLGASVVGTLALSTRAEWAVRMPFCLFGVLGIYAVYLCVSRFVSRRAGVLAAVVTATCRCTRWWRGRR